MRIKIGGKKNKKKKEPVEQQRNERTAGKRDVDGAGQCHWLPSLSVLSPEENGYKGMG